MDGSTLSGNIDMAEAENWYKIEIPTTNYDRIETQAGTLTDNMIYLYGPTDLTFIESDDPVLVVQALEISAFDEAYRTPSPESHMVALRTQQILHLESNVAKVVDPLGGSYYAETLTNDIEKKVWEMIDEVEAMGGEFLWYVPRYAFVCRLPMRAWRRSGTCPPCAGSGSTSPRSK
jgi:hypothetical protein